jgi:dimethylaniline monooxygenase (N-oxide forming)
LAQVRKSLYKDARLIFIKGLSGIVAAQRYLDVHPDANIAILEKDDDIGGVFSKSEFVQIFHNISC